MEFLFTYTPLKFFVQDFWRDEAFSVLLAQKDITSLLQLTAQDFNPPLYYLLLKLWMTIFGSSEIAVRSLSFIFYWGTLYTVFLILRDIVKLSEKKASLYLLFVIFNPLLIYYAFEARMYTMFAFFAALSFYSFYMRRIRLYLLVTGIGLLTHYFMVLVLLSQVVFAYTSAYGKRHLRSMLKKMVLPSIFFIIWLLFIKTQKQTIVDSFWIPALEPKELFLIPAYLYTGYEAQLGFLAQKNISLLFWISTTIAALLGWGVIQMKRNHNHHNCQVLLYFLYWAGIPVLTVLVLSVFKPLFLPRYLIFAVIGLLISLICILEFTRAKWKLIFIFLLATLTLGFHGMQIKHRGKTSVGKTIREIKALAKQNDVIYVTNELDYFTAQYYFDKNRVFIYGKTYTEVPSYVGKALIPKERITNQLPIFPKKAFVLKNEYEYDIQSLY